MCEIENESEEIIFTTYCVYSKLCCSKRNVMAVSPHRMGMYLEGSLLAEIEETTFWLAPFER